MLSVAPFGSDRFTKSNSGWGSSVELTRCGPSIGVKSERTVGDGVDGEGEGAAVGRADGDRVGAEGYGVGLGVGDGVT